MGARSPSKREGGSLWNRFSDLVPPPPGQTSNLDTTALQALLCSASIILTTIQAQDFADVVGDANIGRVTFPIYAPSFSRVFTLVAMIAWSVFLSTHWCLGYWGRIFFCCLGAMIGLRYYFLRESEQDSRSYLYFNVSKLAKFFQFFFCNSSCSPTARF